MSTKGLFDSDYPHPCRDCGGKMVYVGEHWSDEEGICSTYVCMDEYPEDVRKCRNSYRSHIYQCDNRYCERCGGSGWEIKHKKCKYCEVPKKDYKKLCDCLFDNAKKED